MNNKRKNILWALFFSIVIHGIFFIQTHRNYPASVAQAEKVSTRITVSIVYPREKKRIEVVETKFELGNKNRVKRDVKNTQQDVVLEPAQQAAQKINAKVHRDQNNKKNIVKENFISQLLNHIERHKYYPRMARSRGIEGDINVSFRLMTDGNITDLVVNGEQAVLRHAANGAINKAVPMPSCPKEINCPIHVNYVMQFQIR